MTSPSSQFDCLSADYLEQLWEQYLHNPGALTPDWQKYFASWERPENGNGNGHGPVRFRPAPNRTSLFHSAAGGPPPMSATPVVAQPAIPAPPADTNGANGNGHGTTAKAAARSARHMSSAQLQDRVDQLVRAFRVRGHLFADLDPLGRHRRQSIELSPEVFGLTEADLDLPFSTIAIGGPPTQTLREIVGRLYNTYCRAIGTEFMHIGDLGIRDWLQHRMEETENHLKLDRASQLRILTRLTDAVVFEEFCRKKYVGAKTFSLEGAESLIPLLHLAIEKSAAMGVDEIVLGMAHRGRLNVLVNIMGKSAQQMFREFEDREPELSRGRGDVKYHLGYSSDWTSTSGKKVHLSLCFNPSHLEYVNPVALGRMRAKQDRAGDRTRVRGTVFLIHGDAAFAGEGITQETLNLSELRHFSTGGTLHVIVNNQVGFTTPPEEARSTRYATDVAKMLDIPIFHVNGEDPEAVAQVVTLALEFRETFHRDAVIDMYCYRRQGHNESDEPGFTQPLMYQAIAKRASVRDGYLERLLRLNEITKEEADAIAERRREHLETELNQARAGERSRGVTDSLLGVWHGFRGGDELPEDDIDTGESREKIGALLDRWTQLPEGFHLHRKLTRFVENRRAMGKGEMPLDWSTAEAVAMASLVEAGHPVRLCGQDAGRGTFSHRHAILHDSEMGSRYIPLEHVRDGQAKFEVINSPLSESGVLGFEYGYSLDCPHGLVLWEAQFGDFVNVAQPLIDQFITSAEEKWRRLSGLVMLLPHGMEGQGPEHSSARLERFLTQAAEQNIQIVCPTTPAQYFHVLRRQVLRKWLKPLVVFTHKSLLRHPRVVSPIEDFASGKFQRVLPDPLDAPALRSGGVERVILTSGKIYFELLEQREEQNRTDVALIRVEQFYPFPEAQLRAALDRYVPGTPVYWVQEEPENMGAWRFLRVMFGERLFDRFPLGGIMRPASASPATGSHSSHHLEQNQVLAQAFGEI